MGRQIERRLVGEVNLVELRLALENRHPRLQIGCLDLGDQPPCEAAAQAILDARELRGELVGGEHDLFVGVVERVEGVKELVLRAVLVRKELDVVDDQHVGRRPVAGAELLHRAAAAMNASGSSSSR